MPQATADPYWSRSASTWAAVDRVDPVVWPAESITGKDSELSPEQLRDFDQNGYYHAPGLLSQTEASTLLAEANSLAEEAAHRPTPGVVLEPGSRCVRSLFRLHRTSDTFRALIKDPRLVDVARRLLGSEVYVHQSRINFKPAFDGKQFFWHSDFETWHVEDGMPRMRAVSVSISLTGNHEFNGPLIVIPGSHRKYIRCVGATPENHFEQSLKSQEYGVPSRDAMRELVQAGGMTAPKGSPGSALFFECNLMHGSGGNLSPDPRTNLFVVYNSVENGMTDPFGEMPPRPEFLAEREVVPVSAM